MHNRGPNRAIRVVSNVISFDSDQLDVTKQRNNRADLQLSTSLETCASFAVYVYRRIVSSWAVTLVGGQLE